MTKTDRRTFIKLMGTPALAAALPHNIARVLELPGDNRSGSIRDIEHIVILTQENRSFDHHFGTMKGVRGFADPRVPTFPSGQPVWFQPNGAGYTPPFRPGGESVGLQFLPDPPHGWNDGHQAWNQGRYDQWIAAKGGVATMTHHTREDLPYHHAVADAFTVCDAYHCSIMGPTDPNRYHMWTGWVGNDGQNGGPVITNAELGYDWSTFPERLERAGISWKIYQDEGVGLDAAGSWGWTGDAPYIGNYGDNSLLYFHQYQNALAGSPLYERARRGTTIRANGNDPRGLVDMFREDVRRNRLPQVSWIAAPEAYSEHPNWPANWGAWYISQFIDALVANPEVWSKTVLFVNYDEDGGFFDHMVPPTPPQTTANGLSTVSTVNEIFPGDGGHPAGPYGLGVRVPLIIVSPWTKGGWVNSQVFDHTSLIKFIEARFAHDHPGLIESNITPWRRAVAGDLTSAFDFRHPERWRRIVLPTTESFLPPDYVSFYPSQSPTPPASPQVPAQETGVKPARALPYNLQATAAVLADGSVHVEFVNTGEATAVFQVRSGHPGHLPRTYTVRPHRALADTWAIASIGATDYDLSVHGPNGFFRGFKGSVAPGRARLAVTEAGDRREEHLTLEMRNMMAVPCEVRVWNRYTTRMSSELVFPDGSITKSWPVQRFHGWYELVIRVVGDVGFEYRFAGHLEDGRDSFTDPLMGGLL